MGKLKIFPLEFETATAVWRLSFRGCLVIVVYTAMVSAIAIFAFRIFGGWR
jgi:hypothetical protein